ncbi:hypothetical protein EDD22DRAFT_961315 [Suillus occidentalis]|nr:hypothetical protein EDD22DRAFT_961315 [Suillus occidentalis]
MPDKCFIRQRVSQCRSVSMQKRSSPAHPTRSPTPEQIQDPTSLESYWGAEPPRSTASTEAPPQDPSAWGVNPPYSPASEEGFKPWGYSPWAETDASKFEWTEDFLWGTDATKMNQRRTPPCGTPMPHRMNQWRAPHEAPSLLAPPPLCHFRMHGSPFHGDYLRFRSRLG